MAISIVIADDHAMVREGLKCLLELDDLYEVVGVASDGYECLDVINKTNPDIIILDINMPKLDGLQTLKIMRQEKIQNKVIIVTINDDVDYLIQALDYECNGYVLKNSEFDILKEAINAVVSGDTFIEPRLMNLLNSNLAKRDIKKSMIDAIKKRELEILKLVSKGMLNKEIASQLNISERTVKNHISNIFKKIDVSDRTQAAVFAIKNGVVDIK